MPRRSSNTRTRQAKRPHSWFVLLIRKKGEPLGTVEAPDQASAEAAAVERYGLTAAQRARLMLTERRP
jgi:hypothetical protein